MADINKMDRTWLCSVVFMDIVNYSSQSVDTQMKWKQRFNGYLMEAIQNVPESERVILDTGDGAAICFLGAPEAAMFAALQLCNSFVQDERQNQPGLCVRLGINLGPVKLVKDINGALNAIGDGINAGQRIMSFASENKILVSQSFFEVVSRLSDDYKLMFHLKGIEKDKHIREHTVYHLAPPAAPEKHEQVVANAEGQAMPTMLVHTESVAAPAYVAAPSVAASSPGVAAGPAPAAPPNRSMVLLIGGVAALVVLAAVAVGAWRFLGSASAAKQNSNPAPVVQTQASIPTPAPTASPAPAPAPAAPPVAQATQLTPPPLAAQTKPAAPKAAPRTAQPPPSPTRAAQVDPAKLLQEGSAQLAAHPEAARESFRRAAEAGNPQAAVLLGTLYAQGLGGPPSDSDAVRMFRQAADLGYARGMYWLGVMYEQGRGVAGGTDNRAAAHWYTEAANRRNVEASYRLALMYEEGRGVTRDLNEARRLYTQAGTPDALMRKSKLPAQ